MLQHPAPLTMIMYHEFLASATPTVQITPLPGAPSKMHCTHVNWKFHFRPCTTARFCSCFDSAVVFI